VAETEYKDETTCFIPAWMFRVCGLPPSKIQEKIFFKKTISGDKGRNKTHGLSVQSSDGKFVNVGNFDSDGLNVNNDTRDNRNSILGVCPARQYYQCILRGPFPGPLLSF
jgi:hypothetical protein